MAVSSAGAALSVAVPVEAAAACAADDNMAGSDVSTSTNELYSSSVGARPILARNGSRRGFISCAAMSSTDPGAAGSAFSEFLPLGWGRPPLRLRVSLGILLPGRKGNGLPDHRIFGFRIHKTSDHLPLRARHGCSTRGAGTPFDWCACFLHESRESRGIPGIPGLLLDIFRSARGRPHRDRPAGMGSAQAKVCAPGTTRNPHCASDAPCAPRPNKYLMHLIKTRAGTVVFCFVFRRRR